MEVNILTTKIFNKLSNYKFNLITIVIMVSVMHIFHSSTIEEVFKSILVQDYNLIFIFTEENIYSYDSLTLSKKYNYQYETSAQQISSSSDVVTISLTSATKNSNRVDLSLIYIIVKTYLYIFSNEGSFIIYSQINNLISVPTNLIFQNCVELSSPPYCYFLIAYINSDKKLEIIQEKYVIQENSFIQMMNTVTYDIINSFSKYK